MVNGRTVTLEGRAARLVELLVEQAQVINGAERLKLEINCAGPQIKRSLTIFEDDTVMQS